MHILTRFHGYGGILVPAAPFQAERVEGDDIDLKLRTTEGDEPGRVYVEHGLRITPRRFATITESDYRGPWRLETSLFSCDWPKGFMLYCDPETGAPFDLLDGDAMVFVQGVFPPERFADPSALAAPGQVVIASSERHLEVSYAHRGEPYVQRHEWQPHGEKFVVAVTAQAPVAQKSRAYEGARTVLESLRLV